MQPVEQIMIEHQSLLRLGVFMFILLLLVGLERSWPRRQEDAVSSKSRRLSNLLLLVINMLALRVFIPIAAFEVALFAAEKELGLFNYLELPMVINIAFSVLLFDLLIYLQHVAFHKVKFFWNIHRVHHTDLQFDVTTGVRFHPVEIILSMLYKMLGVILFGPAAIAVIIYEILLNAAALFTHSNLKLDEHVDAVLRKIVVTPDMHRVHHSTLKQETDSNYGNIFSFWDRLFRTYRAQPERGHERMLIGLEEYRDANNLQLLRLLKLPFRKTAV